MKVFSPRTLLGVGREDPRYQCANGYNVPLHFMYSTEEWNRCNPEQYVMRVVAGQLGILVAFCE